MSQWLLLLFWDSCNSFINFCDDDDCFIITNYYSECGKVLTESTGIIESPGHPNVYPSGVNCTWHIVVQRGQLIRLVFSSFYLEFHYNCANDYLEVYDTIAQTSLGRWECLSFYAELWLYSVYIFVHRWTETIMHLNHFMSSLFYFIN